MISYSLDCTNTTYILHTHYMILIPTTSTLHVYISWVSRRGYNYHVVDYMSSTTSYICTHDIYMTPTIWYFASTTSPVTHDIHLTHPRHDTDTHDIASSCVHIVWIMSCVQLSCRGLHVIHDIIHMHPRQWNGTHDMVFASTTSPVTHDIPLTHPQHDIHRLFMYIYRGYHVVGATIMSWTTCHPRHPIYAPTTWYWYTRYHFYVHTTYICYPRYIYIPHDINMSPTVCTCYPRYKLHPRHDTTCRGWQSLCRV